MTASRSDRRRTGSPDRAGGKRDSRRSGEGPRAAAGKGPAKGAPAPPSAPTPASAAAPARRAEIVKLALSGLAVLLFLASARLGSPQPWSYDEYYHLGVAREMTHHFPLRSFPWAPFSILADHFADKDFLFHIVLMPLSGLSLETAGTAGVVLGLAFFVACFAFALWRLRAPRPWAWLLGLALAGPLFAYRASMCRPHLWMIGFAALTLAILLPGRRPWLLLPVTALFALTHTAAWIAVAFAVLWGIAGWLVPGGQDRCLLWRPAAWAAAGWLLGQLVHPNVPDNFRLAYLQNLVVPFQSTGAGSAALEAMTGAELTPLDGYELARQWPAFLAPAAALALLAARPRLRTRSTLTAALLATAFLLAGSLRFQRLFEVGAPLGLLALATIAGVAGVAGVAAGSAAGSREPPRPLLGGWAPFAAALAVLVGGLWTGALVRLRPLTATAPIGMARWLAENGRPGEKVFTAQWADSAPIFYFAPQLRTLVALDPTFFFARDPALFTTYADIAFGRNPDPAAAIARRFGSQLVTVWRAPAFSPLAAQLARDPRAQPVYLDPYYAVFRLEAGKIAGGAAALANPGVPPGLR